MFQKELESFLFTVIFALDGTDRIYVLLVNEKKLQKTLLFLLYQKIKKHCFKNCGRRLIGHV